MVSGWAQPMTPLSGRLHGAGIPVWPGSGEAEEMCVGIRTSLIQQPAAPHAHPAMERVLANHPKTHRFGHSPHRSCKDMCSTFTQLFAERIY